MDWAKHPKQTNGISHAVFMVARIANVSIRQKKFHPTINQSNHKQSSCLINSCSCSGSPLPSSYLDNILLEEYLPLLFFLTYLLTSLLTYAIASNFQSHPCYLDSLVFKQLSNAVTPAKGIHQRGEDSYHMTI